MYPFTIAVTTAATACLLASCTSAPPAPPGVGAGDIGSDRPGMRLAWRAAEPGPIQHWLVCGPFSALAAHQDDDLAGITPVAGQALKRPDGTTATWLALDSRTGIVDLCAAFPTARTDTSVAYAYASFDWPREETALLSLPNLEGLSAFVNGRRVAEALVRRGLVVDENVVRVPLHRGRNRLLLKIENVTQATCLSAQVAPLGDLKADIPVPPGEVDFWKLAPTVTGADARTLTLQLDTVAWQQAPQRPMVQVQMIAPGGAALALASGRRGDVAHLDISALPGGPYELRCTCVNGLGETVVAHVPWFKGDMRAAVRELTGAVPVNPDQQLIYPMLAALVRDRLDNQLDGNAPIPQPVYGSVHAALMEFGELRLGRAAQIHPYGFLRLAYRDGVDDSAQFCRVYLPAGYDPGRKWPLVVLLHGANAGNLDYIHLWNVSLRHSALAERYGVIVIEPHGRGNVGFQGIGEADVLRSMAMAEKLLSIDDRRVLLVGYSMGGGGTWSVGTHHPELFAGLAPCFGGWDYRATITAQAYARMTPLGHLRAERASSFAMAEDLLTTPVFINHGDGDDLVSVANSRYGAQLLQRWGYEVRYWEHPGAPHDGFCADDEIMRWFLPLRLEQHPRQVCLRAPDLKLARAHWLMVTQRADPIGFVTARARVSDDATIHLDSQNVLEARILPSAPVDANQPLTVVWNGMAVVAQRQGDGSWLIRSASYGPQVGDKSPAREGPGREVRCTPFAIVIGTVSPDPEMRAACAQWGQRLVEDWQRGQKVMPRVFRDDQISDADMARYSLILVGDSRANRVTRRLADRVPLRIDGSQVVIDGHRFSAPDAAVGMVYRHPLNPQCYIDIVAATSPRAMAYHRGAPDDFDFCIVDRRMPGGRAARSDDRLWLAAGRFDCHWRYCPQATWIGDPAARAAPDPSR